MAKRKTRASVLANRRRRAPRPRTPRPPISRGQRTGTTALAQTYLDRFEEETPRAPSPAMEGLRGREPTFRKIAALDVVNQGIDRGIRGFFEGTGIAGLTQQLTRALRGGVFEFPKLFGGEAFVPQASFPPRGVTRERFLRATQEYGSAPSRLALGAPTGLFEQTDLPAPERSRFRRGPALGYYVWYAKQLMSAKEEEPLYDPGAYYPSGAGGGGGGGVVVVRGGGTPGSQGRNYSSGLINWRI